MGREREGERSEEGKERGRERSRGRRRGEGKSQLADALISYMNVRMYVYSSWCMCE